MSTRVRDVLMQELSVLRHEPLEKRISARFGDEPVVDSTRALVVWEPRRIVPQYAVPIEDVIGELRAAPPAAASGDAAGDAVIVAGRPVLDGRVPFSVHTIEGEALEVRARDGDRVAAAFRPADPDLADHVLLDFTAFDAWFEEDERNVGHPRDPFHRIDILRSSRSVTVERAGEVLAQTTRPYLLFEPPLPVRYYLPPEDVRTDLLGRSQTTTTCAYKGHASYLSHPDEADLAWYYPEPLREAAEVAGRIAFFNERVDLVVDGTRLERPVTPWSPR